jgi:arabinofuranosyltransferase
MDRLKRFRPWLPLVGLLAVAAVAADQEYYFRHYVNDDAYITFRYSRFLALGRGPYYNLGEHVEGYSNLSLMLLIAAVIRALGPAAAPIAAKLAGAASGLASLALAFLLTRRLLVRAVGVEKAGWWGVAAAGLVAVNPAFALNTMSGLETAPFAFTLMLAAYLGVREAQEARWRGSGLAFAAAILTRPEGPALLAVFWIVQAAVELGSAARAGRAGDSWPRALLRRPLVRILIINAAIVSLVFLAQLVFRLIAYDGEWLPNTYYAKTGGFSAKDPAAVYIYEGLVSALYNFPGLALALAGYIVGRKKIGAAEHGPVAAMAVFGGLLPFLTGTDWMLGWRMSMPHLPLLAAAAAVGWALLMEGTLRRWAWAGIIIALVGLPVMWKLQSGNRTGLYDRTFTRAHGYDIGHRALARWLNENAKPGDTVALMDIGIVGYECIDLRILDITGLTDRYIAKSPGPFLDKDYDPKYILDRRPEFIVLVMRKPVTDPDRQRRTNDLNFWLRIEEKIYRHPDFMLNYLNFAAIPDRENPLPVRTGAVRIFLHAHPDMLYYYLAVFRSIPHGK